jgi:hypothetical protein
LGDVGLDQAASFLRLHWVQGRLRDKMLSLMAAAEEAVPPPKRQIARWALVEGRGKGGEPPPPLREGAVATPIKSPILGRGEISWGLAGAWMEGGQFGHVWDRNRAERRPGSE